MIVERKMLGKIIKPQQIVVDRPDNQLPVLMIKGKQIGFIQDFTVNDLMNTDEIKLYGSPPKTTFEPDNPETICSKDKILASAHYGIIPEIKKVVFNNPATIVFWATGEKTIVKCQDNEPFDKEKGLALCVMKYIFGNKSSYNNIIKKFVGENYEQ